MTIKYITIKKLLICTLAGTLSFASCNNNSNSSSTLSENTFRMEGRTINNPDKSGGGKIYYVYHFNEQWHQDSVVIVNNQFTIQDELACPTTMYMSDNKDNLWTPPEYLNNVNTYCFIEPTIMKAEVDLSNWDSFKLSGSKSQEDLLVYNSEMKSFWEENGEIYMNPNLTEGEKQAEWDAVRKLELAQTLRFIQSHPQSYVAFSQMIFMYRSYDNNEQKIINSIFIAMPDEMKNTDYGKYLKRLISEKMKNGDPAPDFTVVDIKGKEVSLKELRKHNKYILLDFWASWCSPCRLMSPMLVEMYKLYHSKGLEIVSISVDKNEKQWKDAIEKDGTGLWIHIRETEGLNSGEGSLLNKYNICMYPTMILINEDGKIAEINVDNDVENVIKGVL